MNLVSVTHKELTVEKREITGEQNASCTFGFSQENSYCHQGYKHLAERYISAGALSFTPYLWDVLSGRGNRWL